MSSPIEMNPVGASLPPYTSKPPPSHPSAAAARGVPRPGAEPASLGQGYRQAEDLAKAAVRPREGAMDAGSMFGMVAAGWYSFLSLPMLLLPRLILFLAQNSDQRKAEAIPSYDRTHFDALTPLESFLVRMVGFGLLGFAAMIIFNVVPAYTAPYPARTASITVVAVLSCVAAVVAWNAPLGAFASIVGLGNGLVGAWGWWTIFFGGEEHKMKRYLKDNSRLKKL